MAKRTALESRGQSGQMPQKGQTKLTLSRAMTPCQGGRAWRKCSCFHLERQRPHWPWEQSSKSWRGTCRPVHACVGDKVADSSKGGRSIISVSSVKLWWADQWTRRLLRCNELNRGLLSIEQKVDQSRDSSTRGSHFRWPHRLLPMLRFWDISS